MLSAKHAYYYTLRTETRRIVVEDFVNKCKENPRDFPFHGMVIGSIDQDALREARTEWPKYYSETTHNGFSESWEALHKKFYYIPSFFDVAIWRMAPPKRTLQAQALGKPSDGKTHLTLNWLKDRSDQTIIRVVCSFPSWHARRSMRGF